MSRDQLTCHIPRTEQQTAIARIRLDLLNQSGQLIDALPSVVRVTVHVFGAKVPPLKAVDRTEIALLPTLETVQLEKLQRAVRIPDVHTLLGQLLAVGRAGDEPEQLLGDRFEVHLLGGQQRESVLTDREKQTISRQSKRAIILRFQFVKSSLASRLPSLREYLNWAPNIE